MELLWISRLAIDYIDRIDRSLYARYKSFTVAFPQNAIVRLFLQCEAKDSGVLANSYASCDDNRRKIYAFVNEKHSDVYLCEDEAVDPSNLDNIIMNAFRHASLLSDTLMIHGATVIQEDSAVIFCGIPGAGKSTQAQLWSRYLDSWVLNFDKTIVIKKERFYAHGSPWSGKEYRYINSILPIKGIVFVEKSSIDCVRRMSIIESFAYMYNNNELYSTSSVFSKLYQDIIEEICKSLPVYLFQCTRNESAVKTLYDYMGFGSNFEDKKERKEKMKIRDGFIVRSIADEWIVIARGEEALKYKSTIILNESGKLLWDILINGASSTQMEDIIVNTYGIDRDIAKEDVKSYIMQLFDADVLEKVVYEDEI